MSGSQLSLPGLLGTRTALAELALPLLRCLLQFPWKPSSWTQLPLDTRALRNFHNRAPWYIRTHVMFVPEWPLHERTRVKHATAGFAKGVEEPVYREKLGE